MEELWGALVAFTTDLVLLGSASHGDTERVALATMVGTGPGPAS